MAIRPEEVLRIEDLTVSNEGQNGDGNDDDGDHSGRDDALRKELEGVQNLNQVMERVIGAMTKAKDNMDVQDFILLFMPLMLGDRQLGQLLKTRIGYWISGSRF